MKKLLEKIARRLDGIAKEDLTTAERQIVELLVEAGYLTYTDDYPVVTLPLVKR